MKVSIIPIYVDYFEATVPQVRQAKEVLLQKVVASLEKDHEVQLFGWVTSMASARLAREQLAQSKPDCVLVLPLVAAFSALSDEVVSNCRAPLVLLSAMAGAKVPLILTTAQVVSESQSFGAQAIANGWRRKGIDFQALHHVPGTREGDAALQHCLRPIELRQQLRQLRIGMIGEAFPLMSDVLLPRKDFEKETGARVIRITMKRFVSLMAKVPNQALGRFENALRKTFTFGRFSAREREFSYRAAVAIQQLVSQNQLDCSALNSHGAEGLKSPKLGLMCALGATLATSSGCPIAEVGDLCTAVAMWIGRRLGGAAFYTEIAAAHLSSRCWLLLNSGEYDLQWLRPKFRPKLVPNSNFTGVNGRGLSVCAPLRAGPATLINLSPTPGAEHPYRLLVCEGKITNNWHPGIGVGNACFKVRGDGRALYEQWLGAGPVHHSATSPGHLSAAIRTFCQLQNWRFERIG